MHEKAQMSFKKEHRQETIIYLALWALLFIAPVMGLAIRTTNTNIEFDWQEVFTVWKQYAVFFVVFLIHNHLLAPILIYRQRKWLYIVSCIAIIILFHTYQCNHRPNFREMRQHRMEIRERGMNRQQPPEDGRFRPEDDKFGPGGDEFRPEGEKPRPEGMGPGEMRGPDNRQPEGFFEQGPGREPFNEHRPPLIFGQRDIIAIVVLILMLGMNLGIKLYFRQQGDRKKMKALELQNLEQQLEYLKYQINPHFFMNTLNNIHALVDIDPEKAKQTILELSKMMRFVLYEGNKHGVPLDREIAFLHNYITLMKLRYTDKVRITVNTPEQLPNKEVPPLMFITFVENAFKHGVSYRKESFIDIAMSTDGDTLSFTCRNSRIEAAEDKHGGVGLKNVKQRLGLIYGNDYSLKIDDNPDVYSVNLNIPLLPNTQQA